MSHKPVVETPTLSISFSKLFTFSFVFLTSTLIIVRTNIPVLSKHFTWQALNPSLFLHSFIFQKSFYSRKLLPSFWCLKNTQTLAKTKHKIWSSLLIPSLSIILIMPLFFTTVTLFLLLENFFSLKFLMSSPVFRKILRNYGKT